MVPFAGIHSVEDIQMSVLLDIHVHFTMQAVDGQLKMVHHAAHLSLLALLLT